MTHDECRLALSLPIEPYTTPTLSVHGGVCDLTAGSQGPVPDIGAAGSSFPYDNEVGT